MKSGLNSSRGSALIQAMIATAVLAIVISGMTTFLDNSNRATKLLQQKLEILQLQQDIMRDLSDPGICECNLDPSKNTSTGSLHFNLNNPNSSIELPQLFGTCVGGAPGNPILKKGQKIEGSPTGMSIEKIQLTKIQPSGTGLYKAKLEVSFEGKSLVMGRKPATINVSLNVDTSNPAQAHVVSCTSGESVVSNASASSCPTSTLSSYTGAVNLPEAPLGTLYYNDGFNVWKKGIASDTPPCGRSYFECGYTATLPQRPAWRHIFDICPPDGVGGGAD